MYKQQYLKYDNKIKKILKKNVLQQGSGVLYKHKNGKIYNGAGVILIENYIQNDKNTKNYKKQGLAVVLFRDKSTKLYADLGGQIEQSFTTHPHPLAKTAMEEAYEESRHLIKFTDTGHIGKQINSKDIYVENKDQQNNTYYRCYFVGVNNGIIKKADYMNNADIIDKDISMPPTHKETDMITRVFFNDLVRFDIMNARGDMQCVDVYDNPITIFGRTKACIRLALQQNVISDIFNVNVLKNQPLISWNKQTITTPYGKIAELHSQ